MSKASLKYHGIINLQDIADFCAARGRGSISADDVDRPFVIAFSINDEGEFPYFRIVCSTLRYLFSSAAIREYYD